MLKIFKEPIKVKTPDGYKTAYGIRKLKKEAIRIHFDNISIDASLNHKFVENNKEVYAKDVKINDILSNKKVTKIEPIGEIDVYDLTDVDGHVYYTNDILSHNCAFLGSSATLVSGEALKEIENNVKNIKPLPNLVLNGLNLYKEPIKNHSYIISVDPSKDGIDKFSINVTDVTQFPFIQVADANLDVDYIIMPEHLNELGLYFNTALIIVENNEGAGQSITDTLYNVYEYENLYRDKNIDGKPGHKKFTGFRTTTKSRSLILNLLKVFLEEQKLIINSQETLNQLYTFTKRKTGNKYEADDGFFDDNIMSLAIMFAPFMNNKTFDDYELFVTELKKEESTQRTAEFLSELDFGFSSDGDDEDYEKELMRREMMQEIQNSGIDGFSISEDLISF